MAKKAYIGAANVAQKLKKGYIGVDEKARRIRKGYIGVNGLARPCWSGGELAYYGVVTPLSVSRLGFGSAAVGGKGLFAGGGTALTIGATHYTTVDVYDAKLTRSAAAALSAARWGTGSAAIPDTLALFGGGYQSGSLLNAVDAYGADLTRTNTSLSAAKNWVSGSYVGQYALLAGGLNVNGSTSYQTVDAYDADLTRKTPPNLYVGGEHGGCGVAGVYALYPNTTSTAYNENLTRVSAGALPHTYTVFATSVMGTYALVTETYQTTVNIYDKSLTRTQVESRSAPSYATAVGLGEFALVAGGYKLDGTYTDTVDCYDKDFTRTPAHALSAPMGRMGALAIGDYAIFAAGEANGGGATNVVNAYTIV